MKKTFCAFCMLVSSAVYCQTSPAYIDTLFYGKNGLQNKVPRLGLSIGIIENGKTNFYSYGFRSHSSKQYVDSNTVFEIGSNTKLFTGLLLALEMVKKEIPKDATIDAYLPENILQPALKNKIKLADLVSFSSGLPTLNDDENDSLLFIQDSAQPYKNVNRDYILNLLKKTAAIPDHGTYAYSNFNYAISGLILEHVTDKKYDELLSEEIFKPLHFTQTFTDSISSENLAAGYLEGNKVPYLELDALKPAGIIKSTAVDLIKFLQAELLPSNNDLGKAMQLTQETLLQTPDFATGFGWHIFTDDENNKAWLMQGDTIGNSSMLYFDRKNNVGIVLLTNESNHNLVATIMDFLVNSISQN